jgi:hypothetical protein
VVDGDGDPLAGRHLLEGLHQRRAVRVSTKRGSTELSRTAGAPTGRTAAGW